MLHHPPRNYPESGSGKTICRGLKTDVRLFRSLALLFLTAINVATARADLPDLVERTKPSVVVIGTYSRTRSPAFVMRGTGFVVANGTLVATNAHVLPDQLDSSKGETLVILVNPGKPGTQQRGAKPEKVDSSHDLAVLRIDGPPLPPLVLKDDGKAREGQAVAFMGFPIGGVLGFSPVTHRAIVSAVTPIALPGPTAQQLNEKVVKRLREGAFEVYQLDGTAYPGNSGGPLFDTERGEVLGIINMVFVKGTKESVLSQPSGISFAVPVDYLRDLLHDIP